MSCHRCVGTDTSPQSFLLSCAECKRSWHHTCHIPPLHQQELLARMRATLDAIQVNNLSDWTCKKCKKKADQHPATGTSYTELAQSVVPSVSRNSPMNASADTPAVEDKENDALIDASNPGSSSSIFQPYVSPLVQLTPAHTLVGTTVETAQRFTHPATSPAAPQDLRQPAVANGPDVTTRPNVSNAAHSYDSTGDLAGLGPPLSQGSLLPSSDRAPLCAVDTTVPTNHSGERAFASHQNDIVAPDHSTPQSRYSPAATTAMEIDDDPDGLRVLPLPSSPNSHSSRALPGAGLSFTRPTQVSPIPASNGVSSLSLYRRREPTMPPEEDHLCTDLIRDRHWLTWAMAQPKSCKRPRKVQALRRTSTPDETSFVFTLEDWLRAHRA